MDLLQPILGTTLNWGHDRLECVFEIGADAPVSLSRISGSPVTDRAIDAAAATDQPLVELFTTGSGHRRAASRMVNSVAGARLRYVTHSFTVADGWTTLSIRQIDESTGLEVTAILRSPVGISTVSIQIEVENSGTDVVNLEAVSAAFEFRAEHPVSVDELDLISARNDWLAEGRWTSVPLRAAGIPQVNIGAHSSDPKGSLAQVSTGSWSTEAGMPAAGLFERESGLAWAWQLETNGAWRWEVGEHSTGAYIALGGPNSRDHEWVRRLAPGAEFTTIPVTVAIGADGFESAIAELTRYRRAARRDHPDNIALPVIFNDYMNTLMGDPTTSKLLPLIDAAAEVGAQIFVIDAGWYDETGDWWDSVGEWIPSRRRFPGGLTEVVDRIRSAGMVPGLWLEPEVVGVNSPIAALLPDEAFLSRGGVRIREHDRYHLDLRSPAARAHLDEVIDRLVTELGIGYFKLDYNINAGAGTDLRSDSMGDGLLEHNRAHLAWLEAVLDRHPTLVLENCASGAMRMDFAMMSRLQLQSTSDQQDPLLYPPIAAAAPLAILPEQAANWAYPQPGMSAESAAFTLATSMLGRFYLSGYLNQMSAVERGLVAQAIEAHAQISRDISSAVPFWPLGLPGWTDGWIALGLKGSSRSHLTLWRRPGSDRRVLLELPHLRGQLIGVDVAFPAALEQWVLDWDQESGVLSVVAGEVDTAARTITINVLANSVF